MADSFWTQGLNPEQKEAVLHDHGPLLILAGAGSGKTTVLVSRTGRLIDENKAKASEILVLTFTNKAARELKHRVELKVKDRAKGLVSGTFHSFGLQILKKNSEAADLPTHFSIIDTTDSHSLLRDLLKNVKNSARDKFDLDRLMNLINHRRTQMAMGIKGSQGGENLDEAYNEMADLLLPRFVKTMNLLGVVDFEGLLIRPIELMQKNEDVRRKIQNQFSQVMVDEFQDTNALQMKFVDLLTESHHNLSVVGDDDQSIYGWRGAEVRNILDFPKTHTGCRVIKLERNYRSTENILKLANRLIENNKSRHGKSLKTDRVQNAENTLPEVFIFENEAEEGDFIVQEVQRLRKSGIPLRDMAVLYRSNTQGAWLEGDLRRARIEYQLSGSTSLFDRKEIKDIYSYLRQAIVPADVHLKRIINTPARGLGEVALEKLSEYSKTHKCSFWIALKNWKAVGLPEKTGEDVEKLLHAIYTLNKDLFSSTPTLFFGDTVGAKLIHFLRHIGYRDYLISLSSEKGSFEKKWVLVEVFARIFDNSMQKNGLSESSVIDFLDSFLLRDQEDDKDEKDKLQLMTLHASKGLEFPVVILAGIEEDLLPHRSLGSNIDEERRLFYVGVTRAEKKLIMTRCQSRVRHGSAKKVAPSRFLLEIPKDFYTEFNRGVRPVSGQERQSLVEGFLKSLDVKTKDT